MDDLYVMGGAYPTRDDQGNIAYKHALVKPQDADPYVTTNQRGSIASLTRHHAHVYRLDPDRKTATLAYVQTKSDHVLSPRTLVLSDDDFRGVQRRINGTGLDGISAG